MTDQIEPVVLPVPPNSQPVNNSVRQRRTPPPANPTINSTSMVSNDSSSSRNHPPPRHARAIGIMLVLTAVSLLIAVYLLGMLQSGDWINDKNVLSIATKEHVTHLDSLVNDRIPFLLAFYSTSCMACRRMRSPFVKAARNLRDNLECYAVNVAHKLTKDLIRKYNVTAVPSIYMVKGDTPIHYRGGMVRYEIVDFVEFHLADIPHSSHQNASK